MKFNINEIKNKFSNFYEKSKSDLIYTHKKKIEKKISPSLESLLNYKITILSNSSKSKEFSLVLER